MSVAPERIPVIELSARRSSKGKRAARKVWWDERDLPSGVAVALLKTDVMNIIVNLRDGRTVVFENPEAFRQRMALKGREDFA